MKTLRTPKLLLSFLVAFAMLATALLSSGAVLADDTPTQEPAVEEPTLEVPVVEPVEPPAEEPTVEPSVEEPPLEEPTETPVEEPAEAPLVVPLIIEEEGGKVIPGQYIVVYKDGMGGAEVVAAGAAMAEAKGSEILFTYLDSIEGFAAKLSDEALLALRQDERIEFIEADQLVSIHQEEGPSGQTTQNSPPSWGLDRIDQAALPLNFIYNYDSVGGAGVNIYIIDTGIRNTHEQYAGRVTLAFDAIQDSTPYAYDCDGHGTHVAGTAAGTTVGVAKLANLHSVRVLNCDGNGAWSQIIAGVNWVAANHVKPAVANMSLGGWKSSSIDKAVGAAIKKGVTFAVAAGNDDYNASNFSPARVAAAITVGASASTDWRAAFSNYGGVVDIFAPGVNIYSSVMDSDLSYQSGWNGTSMACPHVAGAAALYLARHPNDTPAQVAAALIANSTKGVIQDAMGSQNRLLAVNAAAAPAPVLSAPASKWLTNDNTVLLEWNSSYMNNSYQVEVAGDKYFSDIQFTTITANLNTTTSALPDGLKYWRVRASNVFNQYGAWSAARTFTVDTTPPAIPTQLAPADGATVTGTPTFKWTKPATSLYFEFRYALTSDPLTVLFTSPEMKTVSYKPPVTLVVNQGLNWHVRARDLAGNWSAWSGPFKVTVLPPTPLKPVLAAPANSAFTNDTTPTLSWNAALYAADYHVQLCVSSAFNTFMQDQEGITATNFTFGATLGEQKWYWRVRARNANGVYGPWSAPRNFIVDTTAPAAPVIVSPVSGANPTGTPTFVWKAAAGAKYYQFGYGLSTEPDFYTYQSGTFTRTSYKPPVIAPNTNYYWYVRAIDAAGNEGPWSSGSYFWVKPPTPGKVTVLMPPNNLTTDSTTGEVTWNKVDYGYFYEVEFDDVSKFTSIDYSYISTPEASSVTVGPLGTGKWFWRVRARNVDGVYGAPSTTRIATIYPKFYTQFNSAGNFEGWVQHPGASWSVTGGSLQTAALTNGDTSSASYSGADFTDFTYIARMKKVTPGFGGNNLYGLVLRGNPVFNSWNDWEDGVYFMAQQTWDSYWNEQYTCAFGIRIVNNYWYFMGGSCGGEVNWGDWNKLMVYAKGSTMKFYVNDLLLFTGKATGLTSGRLGVMTYGNSGTTTTVDWAGAGAPIEPVHYNRTMQAKPYLPTAEEMFEQLKAEHGGK